MIGHKDGYQHSVSDRRWRRRFSSELWRSKKSRFLFEIEEKATSQTEECAHKQSPKVELDENVWSRLPRDLADQVYRRLPHPIMLHFKAVCKGWNGIVPLSLVISQCGESSSHGSYIIVWEVSTLPTCVHPIDVYDPSLNRWHSSSWFPPPFFNTSIRVLAANGGLFLVSARALQFPFSEELVVFNPLSKKWRKLPPMSLRRSISGIVGLLVDRRSSTYKVVASGSSRYTVYDSKLDEWSVAMEVPFCGKSPAVVCGRSVYWLGKRWTDSSSIYLLGFDLDQGWIKHRLGAPGEPSTLMAKRVLNCHGHILLVGASHSSQPGEERRGEGSTCMKDLQIWEMDKSIENWTKVANMPDYLFKLYFVNHPWGKGTKEVIPCVSYGNKIFFASNRMSRGLIFDLNSKTWSFSSSRPRMLKRRDRASLDIFRCELRFDLDV